jgi:cation-transporting ATPase 13A2
MSPIGGPASFKTSESHDYTEGASPTDIDSAFANSWRSRRDSQYNSFDSEDGEGTTFSGPGRLAHPSRVSRMPSIDSRRTSSETWSRTCRKSRDSLSGRHGSRRSSMDSQVSRQSMEGRRDEDGEEHALLGDESGGVDRPKSRRKSSSLTQKTGVFGNLAQLFGRTGAEAASPERRLSISQLSYDSTSRRLRRSRSDVGSDHALTSEEEDVERWGYTSGEEESDDDSVQTMHDDVSISASMDYDSAPPSPPSAPYGIPLMSSDPIFGGEARLDMETPFTLSGHPPPGPPSRQTIYLSDEDTTVQFVGYECVLWRLWIWRAGCLLTFGTLGLIGHWFPRIWLRWVAREMGFLDSKDGFVVIQVGATFDTRNLNFDSPRDCSQRCYALPPPYPYLPISYNVRFPVSCASRPSYTCFNLVFDLFTE